MFSLGAYKISTTEVVNPPKKALRFMNFTPFNAHTTPLLKRCNILKFAIINFESCMFMKNRFNKYSFLIFNENFK